MTKAYHNVYQTFIKILIIMISNQDTFLGEMDPSVKFNIKTSILNFKKVAE